MSNIVDQRIVEMQFDNKEFEKNIKTTKESLEQFKKSLDLDGAAKSFNKIDKAARSFSLVNIGDQVGVITSGFSSFENYVLGMFERLKRSAIDFAKNMADTLTIDAMKAGFQEYETQIGAQQTILMGVMDSQFGGDRAKALNAVNKSLSELNQYADQTIYNFTQMTKSIGRFTAQGVNLEDATSGVKGIANLAALAGSTAEQADSAMYMMSQALAQGKVSMYQWRSLESSGLANESFRRALMRTADAMGVVGEEQQKAYAKLKQGDISFRESLSKGWLSSDILIATLKQYAGEVGEAELAAMGFTSEERQEILKMGKDAQEAATKVKTFTQLIDVLKEALQSGWTQSWQIIFGDLDEAKEMWSGVSDFLGRFIEDMAFKRNQALKIWKANGGKNSIINGIKSLVEGFTSIVSAAKKALLAISPFGKNVGEMGGFLTKASRAFERFGNAVKTFIDNHYAAISGVFNGIASVIGVAISLVSSFFKGIVQGIRESSPESGTLFEWLGSFGESIARLSNKLKESGFYEKIIRFISGVVKGIGLGIRFIIGIFKSIDFSNIHTFWSNFRNNLTEPVNSAILWIKNTIGKSKILSFLGSFLSGLFGRIVSFVKNAEGIDLGVAILGIMGIAGLRKVFGLVNSVKKLIKGTSKGLSGVFESVSNLFERKKEGTLPKNIMYVAAGVALLAYALKTISTIDADAIGRSLLAMAALLAMVTAVAFAFSKIKFSNGLKLGVTSFGLIALGAAMLVFAKAVANLGKMDTPSIVQGILGLAAVMAAIGIFMVATKKSRFGILKGTGLILLAAAMNIFAKAVSKFGGISSQKTLRGIQGMGAVLVEIGAFMALTKKTKFGISKGTGLVLTAAALVVFANAVQKFASIDGTTLINGIASMGAVLLEVVAFMALTRNLKFGASKGIGLITLAASMIIFANAVTRFAELDSKTLIRGLVGMGSVMLELLAFMALTQKLKFGFFKGLGLLTLAASILVFANAIKQLGSLDNDVLLKGIAGVGAVLLELAVFMGIATKTRFGLFKGAGLILLAMALIGFAKSVEMLGGLDSKTILKGVSALGAVLLELAVFVALAGKFKFGVLKGAALFLVGKMMVTFADSVKKLGSMKTRGLIRGIVGMAAILGEIAAFTYLMGKIPLGGALKSLIVLIAFAVSLQVFAIALKKIQAIDPKVMITFGTGFGAALLGLGVGLSLLSALPITAILLAIGKLAIIAAALIGGMMLFGKLEELLGVTKYIDLFGDIVGSVGKAIGKFIGGIASGMTSNFVSIGTDLSNFMTNAEPFIEGAKKIDATVIDGIKNLTKVLLLISAGNIVDAVSRLLTFGRDPIDNFAEQAASLGPALMNYANSVEGFSEVNQNDVNNATAAAKGLVELLNALPAEGGLLQKIIGAKDLASFSEDLPSFGSALSQYAEQIKEFNTVDENSISNANSIGKGLVEILNSMPAEGGLLQRIVGAKDLSSFSEDIPGFADALRKYGASISKIDKVKSESIETAHDIAIGLVDVLKALPTEGGLLQHIVGARDLGSFSEDVKPFGDALYKYSQSAKKIGKVKQEDLDGAHDIAVGLVDVLNALPAEGGLAQLILGAKDLASFSEDISTFGSCLGDYAEHVKGFGDYKFEDLRRPITIAQAINDLQLKLPENGIWQIFKSRQSIDDFSADIITLSEALSSYATNIGGKSFDNTGNALEALTAINEFVTEINGNSIWQKLGDALGINTTIGSLGEGIKTFGDSFSSFSTGIESAETAKANMSAVSAAVTSLIDLVNYYDENGLKERKVKKLAAALSSEYIGEIVLAFMDGERTIKQTAYNAAYNASNEAGKTQSQWETVGGNLMTGLNNGLVNKERMLYDTARTIANSIIGIFRGVMSIHSPSLVFQDFGMYIDQGLARGISKYATDVYRTVEDTADGTVRTAEKMLLSVSRTLSEGIDATPVIRPVLDLSEVESGASGISGLFNTTPTVRTGLFSDAMFRRNANMLAYEGARPMGSNQNRDIVTAVRSLSDKFDHLSESVSNMQMVLDSGELVGRLGTKIDRNLGVIAGRRERGN